MHEPKPEALASMLNLNLNRAGRRAFDKKVKREMRIMKKREKGLPLSKKQAAYFAKHGESMKEAWKDAKERANG